VSRGCCSPGLRLVDLPRGRRAIRHAAVTSERGSEKGRGGVAVEMYGQLGGDGKKKKESERDAGLRSVGGGRMMESD